ncbi:MAG: hypothetical protein V2B17_02425 [Chloroflexota bacterium]
MAFDTLLASADRAALNHLGGPVSYTTGAGAMVEVVGIFDAAFVLVDAGQADVSSCSPAVFLLLSDLPSDPTEDAASVEIDGTAYSVREARPDGKGGVVLLLHEEA